MSGIAIGDGVTVLDGPMKGIYGVLVWFYEARGEYLVRFAGGQQMYYKEEQIVPWQSRPT